MLILLENWSYFIFYHRWSRILMDLSFSLYFHLFFNLTCFNIDNIYCTNYQMGFKIVINIIQHWNFQNSLPFLCYNQSINYLFLMRFHSNFHRFYIFFKSIKTSHFIHDSHQMNIKHLLSILLPIKYTFIYVDR